MYAKSFIALDGNPAGETSAMVGTTSVAGGTQSRLELYKLWC